jgi:DNA-binding MarR family transcriptional regulator
MKDTNVQLLKEKFRQLERSLTRELLNQTECCGLTIPQRHVLLEVGRRKEVTLVDLSAALGLDTSTLSRTVNSVVTSGLVSRILNPKDRRYVLISLTKRGKAIFATIERSSDDFYRRVFRSLPEKKERQVVESLVLLVDELGKFREAQSCRACKDEPKKGAE